MLSVKPVAVFVRGGGDLASGVVMRLFHAGLQVIITELVQPLVVRRSVSFANAVYEGHFEVEGLSARRSDNLDQALAILRQGEVPVLVDPHFKSLKAYQDRQPAGSSSVLVDGRMTKTAPNYRLEMASLIIGLGPGFVGGQNCHAAVETNRGHFLGRVIWQGAPQADTGIPESVAQQGAARVLRAPVDGILNAYADIGDHLEKGQPVAEVGGQAIFAAFSGVLRGLVYPGLQVRQGQKIGDVDPRGDPLYCQLLSDKALSIGGAVLEAILSQPALRFALWEQDAPG